ncbi:MAG: shikimate kinase [Bacteroides sp.]|nr:shikimate kinase [Eubacterium sp.]MCM1418845.1 shikimate kinase [Roseburia sp.]MCM1462892.1 shikimate kinase [Bacteroides sp.]
MRNVYLCGFMGCGKSHIGRMLAKRLDRTFIDLDGYIEEHEGMTISAIFAERGEPYFREAEARYIREMPEGSIVATGGGAVINPKTAEAARAAGLIVFLDAKFELCYKRIADDPKRPLVMKNTKEELYELYKTRRAVYRRCATIVVDANGVDRDITFEIEKGLRR